MWRLSGLLVLLSHKVLANVFLQQPARGFLEQDELAMRGSSSNILAQLEEVLGSSSRAATEVRLQDIKEALRPIFDALPKRFNGGKVASPAARYALHRLFIQRHGWQVKGIAADGKAWTANPATDAVANMVSHDVKGLFDDRLNSTGLDLHELAVLASMLEHLIHSEAEDRLKAAYNFSGQVIMQVLSRQSAVQVIETYMVMYLSGFNATKLQRAKMRHIIDHVQKYKPDWENTRKFLREVQRDTTHELEAYSFHDIMSVVEQIGERFGRFQNLECVDLKESLVKLEESASSGRVRLGDFYSGQWHFSESVDYLRELGTLDESDKANLRVIIPNYLNAPSNCVASSVYYSVCCIDECEEFILQLERKLQAPLASPAEVAAIVHMQLADLPSASVAGNRTLSKAILDKLQELADHHGGWVPIHGRLFAQWLHIVYPRECPYPHVSGNMQRKTGKELKASGKILKASEEEKQLYIETASHLKEALRRQTPTKTDKNATAFENACTAMWTMEEELVDEHAHRVVMQNLERADQTCGVCRALLLLLFSCGAIASFVVSLCKTLGQTFTSTAASQKVDAQSRMCLEGWSLTGWSLTPAAHIHAV